MIKKTKLSNRHEYTRIYNAIRDAGFIVMGIESLCLRDNRHNCLSRRSEMWVSFCHSDAYGDGFYRIPQLTQQNNNRRSK